MNTVLVEYESAAYITGLPHRVRIPTKREAPHPAVVLLHGRHGTEDVPWIFARSLPEDWLLVAPRAIEYEPETAEHEIGYSWIFHPETGWPTIDDFDDAVTAIYDFIISLPDVYDADPEQIYLLGFSQGAAAAYATAMRHPGLVKGIAGLVGFTPFRNRDLLPRPLENLPIFVAVGKKDERVRLTISRFGRNQLLSAGANLTYREYDVGHKLNGQGMRDLKAWWDKIAAGELA